MPRHRNNGKPTPAPEQDTDRGVTLNLHNPGALITEWETKIGEAETAARDGFTRANEMHAVAGDHEHKAAAAAADEARLQAELETARQARGYHEQARSNALAEAERHAQVVKASEERADDLRTLIAGVKPAISGVAMDPTQETRIDGSLGRFHAAHDEFGETDAA